MKKQDLFFALGVIALFLPFFFSQELYNYYQLVNKEHAYLMAFFKFAVLATLGESVGLRIKNGVYNEPGFGLLPRAFVWGILGVWIAAAMKTFFVGAPVLVQGFGIEGVSEAMEGDFTPLKLLGSFFISLMMNTTFAPVFMTIHKITDTHILNNQGRIAALVHPLPFGKILASLNWQVQWGFVFKKTIPYFWIPAHTITFLLPPQFQVLFAAFLGIVLGVFLSVAAIKARQ